MTLAVGMGAGEDRDVAARIEMQAHALVEDASVLDVAAARASAHFACGFRSRLPLPVPLPVRKLHALVHEPLELAAVIDRAGCRGIGHRFWSDEVAPPDFVGPDTKLDRRTIEQALDDIVAFGASGAAVDAKR